MLKLAESVKSEVAIKKNYTAPTQDHPTMGKFTFRFCITDPENTFSSITVTEMTAQYKDGVMERMPHQWGKEFTGLRRPSDPNRPIHLNVESLLFRHENVTVTFKGFLTTEEGKRIPFSANEKFRAGADRGDINLLLNPGAYT